jgi:hypothetical protein
MGLLGTLVGGAVAGPAGAEAGNMMEGAGGSGKQKGGGMAGLGEKVKGGALATLFSAGQMVAGAINRKKADALLPPSENPMERQLLNTIRRRRQALMSGTASSADRAAVRQMGKTYQNAAFNAGGPVSMAPINQFVGQALSNITNQNAQQANQLLGMEGEQVKSMANLANDLALLRSNRKSAQGEQQMQAGTQNLLASLGRGNFYGQKTA